MSTKLSDQYAKAMNVGDTDTCLAIELKHGLDGFPPELVSVGLKALELGNDPYMQIVRYAEAGEPA